MKLSLAFKTLAVSLLALALLITIGVLAHRSIQGFIAATHLSYRAALADDALLETFSTLQDAETGQRGYLITGDERHLAPYERAMRVIDGEFAELQSLMAGNQQQLSRLEKLWPLVDARLASLKQGVQLRQQQGFEAAQKMVAEGSGKKHMEDIRRLVAEIGQAQHAVVNERQSAVTAQSEAALNTILAMIIAGSVLLIAGVMLISHEIQARHKAEAALKKANAELQLRVREQDINIISTNTALQSEIAERNAAEARAEVLATRDALTDLPNRRVLATRLEQAIAAAARHGDMLAFMFIDLDRFKVINDSLGHFVGDRLLKQISARLAGTVRESDTVARLGGDEFAVVLEGVKRVEDAIFVVQKILASLARPHDMDGMSLNATCSIGLSFYPHDCQDAETLMRNADTAMYHAKEDGRNCYRMFSVDMNERMVERLNLENDLRRAIENDEFVLHYQPQVRISDGTISAVEALIRWQHPQHGLISPTRFIPIAEESGLIIPIGRWVLRGACEQLRAWEILGIAVPRVAVNVSAVQVKPGLIKDITEAVNASGIAANRIELEITESLMMSQAEDTTALLKEIGTLGISLTIDDFGTGYSSLSMLKRLPVDSLKIDQSFIRHIVSDAEDAAIVNAIIAMAHTFDLRVVAEGVETEAQLAKLVSMNCDEMQGYLVTQPVSAEEFARRYSSGATEDSLGMLGIKSTAA